MKLYLLLAGCFVSFFCSSQGKKNTYNTDIKKANKVEIKDGRTYISKADSVYVTIIMQNKSQIFADSLNQRVDSAGIFINYIHLINPSQPIYDMNLIFHFNKPVISVEKKVHGSGSGQENTAYFNNNTGYIFSGKIITGSGIDFIIKSKEQIKINIEGIAGFLKH